MPTADLDLAAITARAAEAKRRVDYIACRVTAETTNRSRAPMIGGDVE